MDYRPWRRFNTSPYISDRHGARFVNVYINDTSGDFFTATETEPMPVGTIIVKDSISAVESGACRVGRSSPWSTYRSASRPISAIGATR